jgi:ATP-dependent Lon protease
MKEKLASARHHGISTVICPHDAIEQYQRELQGGSN